MRWPSFYREDTSFPQICFAWMPTRVVDIERRFMTVWLEQFYRVPNKEYDRTLPCIMENAGIPRYFYYTPERAALDRLTGEQK